MKKQLLLLAFLFCRHLTLFSQYSISGTVKDVDGNALIGANVLIDDTLKGAVTNKNGEFSIHSLEKGGYTLTISFIGYEKVQKSLFVDKNVSLDVILSAKSFIADDVIITAVRATDNMPVTKSKISKAEIKAQNLGQDVPYLLAMSPSLVTSSDAGSGVGYSSFRIRGTDVSRINVTVNGIPLNDAESHGVWWVDLPDFASSVENIQIQRGVGTSTLGGGAFGATINLQTLNLDKKPKAEITNSFGSYNTFKHSVSFGSGLISNHFAFDGRLSKVSSDGYIDRASSDLKSFFLSGAYYNEKTLLKVIISSGFEETYQAWQGVPKARLDNDVNGMMNYLALQADWNEIDGSAEDSINIFNSDPRRYNMYRYKNQVDHYNQDHYQMLFSHSFNHNLNFNAALHYTRGLGYYEQYKPRQEYSDYSLRNVVIQDDTIKKTNLIRRKWLDNDFYGFTWSLNYNKGDVNAIIGGGWNQYYGEHYGRIRWAEFMSNGELDHQYYYSNGIKNDFNVFGKINYSISDNLSVFGDLQLRNVSHNIKGIDDKLKYDGSLRDITQKHEFTFFNPKAGINFNVSDVQSLYAYVGVAHREPTRSNFVDSDPSMSAPKAEKLVDYELGYNLRTLNSQFGINLYYMNYTDQLVHTGMINDVGSPIMTNVAKSYRIGAELTYGVNFLKYLTWNGNATFSRNIISKFTEFVDNWDTWAQESFSHTNTKLSFSPEFIAGSQLILNIKPISFSFTSKFVGNQYIDNTQNNERKLDDYFINDLRLILSLNTKYIRKIDLIANINNVFSEKYETNAWVYQYYLGNQRYKTDGYFPQAPRNFMIGLILNFY